ncbi:MAG: hypothetical protein V4479_10695 [Actinomycetota bacterium]
MLLGLVKLQLATTPSARILLVTGDQKEDWMSFGKPHPILLAELFQLTGHVLDIVKPAEFVKTVRDLK